MRFSEARTYLILIAIVLVVSPATPASVWAEQQNAADLGLPVLHRINTATLGPAYSCRPSEEFEKGYENTALFLSKWSQKMHSPELLFNGACGAKDFLQSSVAGDDMDLIADLGETRLEDTSAQKLFFRDARYTSEAKVQLNHTYAVLTNRSDVRGLFVFTVVAYIPNQKLDIQYAVKLYQLTNIRSQARGFDWGSGNW